MRIYMYILLTITVQKIKSKIDLQRCQFCDLKLPTRGANILDLVFSNPLIIDNIDSIETSISDHNIIKVVTCIPKSPLKKKCLNSVYCLLSVVLNNYVIKQIAVKSIHKLILFIEQK